MLLRLMTLAYTEHCRGICVECVAHKFSGMSVRKLKADLQDLVKHSNNPVKLAVVTQPARLHAAAATAVYRMVELKPWLLGPSDSECSRTC
jgi:hypothetical protein